MSTSSRCVRIPHDYLQFSSVHLHSEGIHFISRYDDPSWSRVACKARSGHDSICPPAILPGGEVHDSHETFLGAIEVLAGS